MPVTGLITLVAGLKAKASEINTNIAIFASKFAAGIRAGDCAPDAAFTGGQHSTASGSRLTGPNLEDGAVDSRILKSDSGPGSALAAVQTANHVKDGILTRLKMVPRTLTSAEVALAALGEDVLKIVTDVVVVAPANLGSPGQLVIATPPAVARAKSLYDLLAIYVKDPTGISAATTFPMAVADDTGANWTASLRAQGPAGGQFGGSVVYVFVSKT